MFPKKITTLQDKYIIMAACGPKYSCAITSAGELYHWGIGMFEKKPGF